MTNYVEHISPHHSWAIRSSSSPKGKTGNISTVFHDPFFPVQDGGVGHGSLRTLLLLP